MMAGDGPHNVATLNNGAVRVNMTNVDSPLQIFVRAKKKINDIFVEIDDYVKDAVTFMHGEFLLINLQLHDIEDQEDSSHNKATKL